MKRSVGYRNIAVHNYDNIDLSITYDIASRTLSSKFCAMKKALLSLLEKSKLSPHSIPALM